MNFHNNISNQEYSDATLILMLGSEKLNDRNMALGFIYNRYFNYIRSMVVQYSGSSEGAKDVFQEGVVILYENILHGKFKSKSSIKTYFCKICRNKLLQTLKNKNSAFNIDEYYYKGHNIPDETNLEMFFDNHDRINAAITKLDPESKKVLTEFYYNKRSLKELKNMLNLGSEQAVKNRKMRALKKLHTIFEASVKKQDHFFDEYPEVSFFTGKV